jgi:hypothetical protein
MPEDTASTIAAVAIRQAVARLDRRTRWELVGLVPLTFATHHPQGLVFVGEHTFLSSVEILENPSLPANSNRRTPGRGIGHLFVLGKDGTLLRDLRLGEGDMYHPGGIDFDGSKIWVSVAEYRDRSASLILTIDPMSFDVTERFRVPDHVGWVVCDSAKKTVYGGSWGSQQFYAWSTNGDELDHWENPSSFIDYQDCQYAGSGLLLCSGIAILPSPENAANYELGGIALVDLLGHRTVHEAPISLFSSAGHVVTRNPFALSMGPGGLLLHVAPDDGDDSNGTELLTYRAKFAN